VSSEIVPLGLAEHQEPPFQYGAVFQLDTLTVQLPVSILPEFPSPPGLVTHNSAPSVPPPVPQETVTLKFVV
jgi:hypothetical protein